MQWLAVKYFDDSLLFPQSRLIRETQNSVLIDKGEIIETMVVKVFHSEEDAKNYCFDINSINGLIEKIKE